MRCKLWNTFREVSHMLIFGETTLQFLMQLSEPNPEVDSKEMGNISLKYYHFGSKTASTTVVGVFLPKNTVHETIAFTHGILM